MKTFKHYFLITVAAFTLVGCNNDSESPNYEEKCVAGIVNEGGMGNGSGELSYYYENSKTIKNNVFSSANSMSLGAMLQASTFSQAGVLGLACNYPDKLFFCNIISGKMLVTTPFTDQLKTPRGIALRGDQYSTDMAYVTNWGEPRVIGEWDPGHPMCDYPNSYILAINLGNSITVNKKILCGNTAEGILLHSGKLFVALQEGVKVYNAATLDSIGMIIPSTLIGSARQLVVDNNQNLWVSIQGAGVMSFSPTTLSINKEYPAPINYDGKVAISNDGKYIYSYDVDYTTSGNENSNVFKIDLATGEKSPFVTESNALYAIGVNPFSGKIYTANPNDYVSNSSITIYNTDGTKYDQQTSGILSSGFFFFAYFTEE